MRAKVSVVAIACLVLATGCSSSAATPTAAPPTTAPASVAASLAAASVAPSPGPCASVTGSEPLQLGAALPLSGVIAASGRQIQDALTSSATYINAHGGACGHNLQWSFQDNGYPSGTQASVAVRALVDGNALAVLNFGTPGVAATYQYLVDNKVPDLMLFAGLTAFEPLASTAMSVYSDYRAQGAALGQYVAKTYPNKSWAILYQDNDLGLSYLNGFLNYAAPVATLQKYSASDVDFSAQLNAMKASGATMAACFCLTPQVSQMLKFRESSGWNVPVVTESSNAGSSLVTTVGASLTDSVVSMDFFPPTSGSDSTPAMAQLATELQANNNSIALTPYTIIAAGINDFIVQAVGSINGSVTRDSLNTAMHATHAQGAWYGSTVSLPTGRAPALFTCWRMTLITGGVPAPLGSVTCES